MSSAQKPTLKIMAFSMEFLHADTIIIQVASTHGKHHGYFATLYKQNNLLTCTTSKS